MGGMSEFISPEELKLMRRASDVVVVDIRRQSDLQSDGTMIQDAIRGDPESIDAWVGSLPIDKPIIVYCSRGGSVSKTVTPALRARGLDARYIQGGITAWKEFGGEVVQVKST